MGKLIFAFILIVLGFVALRILQNIATHLAPREQDMAARLRLAGRGALAGGLMLASLTVLVGSIFVINAGHVGVISVFGRVETRPRFCTNGRSSRLRFKMISRSGSSSTVWN